MARQKPRSYQVRITPEIWRDEPFRGLTGMAQWAYMDSLFTLASASDPTGVYAHAHLANRLGHREALDIADGLLRIGAWTFAGLGYRVHSYCGWAIVAEHRAAIPAAIRRRVMARDGHRCVLCGATADLALDHIYPWSLGGPDTEENLRVLCRPCNSSKGAKVP